jgi:hypothetical protein
MSSPPPPGVSLATMQPMNGSSQRMAAINNQNASSNYQNNLINATGGRRKYKGGFVNPQNRPLYQEVGGNGQGTASITDNLAMVQSQNYANGVFDATAQQGGRHRRKTRRRVRGGHRRSRIRSRSRNRNRSRRNSQHN